FNQQLTLSKRFPKNGDKVKSLPERVEYCSGSGIKNVILISVFRKFSLPGGKIMTVNYPEVWDLDTLFPGGSESQELRQHMDDASTKLSGFEESVQQFEVPSAKGDAQKVADLLEQMSLMMKHLSQSGAFIGCLMAQNTQDKKAAILDSESSSLSARFQNSFQKIQQDLAKTEESVWEELLNEEPLRDFTFVLNEWREEAKMLLSEKEESLIRAWRVE